MKTRQFTATLLIYLGLSFVVKAQLPIYSESFTGNLGATSAQNSFDGAWVWSNSCSKSSLTGHSAGGHAYFLGSGATCQYGDIGGLYQVSGDLSTPAISIPSTGGYITFNYALENECTGTSTVCDYDILKLQISNNGGSNFTDIMSSDGYMSLSLSCDGYWTAVSYTLPSTYNGQNIIIRFNFDSQDEAYNTFDGVYIDDINVFGFCTPPSVSITASTDTICQGLPVTLTAGGTAVSYSLTTLGSLTNTIANTPVSHIPLVNTTYVMLGADASGCVGAAQQSVYVVTAPTVNVQFVYPTTICSGNNVTITVNGANNYTLDPGGYTSAGLPFVITPNTTTNFSLVGADNSNCLSYNSAIANVSVNPTPQLSVNSGSICAGQGFTMYPDGGNNYLFSNGSSTVNPPAGIYTYTVSSTVDGCAGIPAVSSLTVYTMPNTSAVTTKSNVCTTDAVKLYGYNAENFSWNTGVTGSVVTVNHTSMTTGGIVVYTLTGFNNSGCSKTATVQVKIYICTGINEQQNYTDNLIVYPNPSNGVFTVETNNNFEKNITLIDLTGRVVMTHKTSSNKIDFNINELSKGIYYLQVQAGSERQTMKVLKE